MLTFGMFEDVSLRRNKAKHGFWLGFYVRYRESDKKIQGGIQQMFGV